MSWIILLNGPPYVGKDTLADHLVGTLPGCVKHRMSYELKVRTHRLYDCPRDSWDNADYYDAVKDLPSEDFHGISPRQAYINVSEKYFKPLHGQDFFGRLFVRWMRKTSPEPRIIAIPDSGFAGEMPPLIREVGPMRVLLVRIHGTARGKTFNGDSRSHISLPGVLTTDAFNDVEGDTQQFLQSTTAWIKARTGDLSAA